jgi:hypothetical protein
MQNFSTIFPKYLSKKRHIKVTLIVNKSFILETVALFNTGADFNCIQEGLIPIKFFEKTKEAIRAANSKKL